MFDVAIFGAGVVGTSIFSKLTRIGKRVILFEKTTDVATGASKANSGICHAGYDCEINTLKAKLNVRGCALMPKICADLKVPFIKCGTIVVGSDKAKLEELYNRGIINGVKNMEIIENPKTIIPNLKDNIKFGLVAKDAGIVSPYKLTIAYGEDAVLNGGKIIFEYDCKKIEQSNDCFIISDYNTEYKARIIINASGIGYNDIANLIGSENYDINLRRGEYYVLDKSTDFVPCPVFPLPSALGKGILATPTTGGNILFGPTADDDSEYNTKTTKTGLEQIKLNILERYENVPFNKIIREFSGIRVSAGKDFIIEKSKKIQNVINICGINSPGLTSAPAIGEYVCELLGFDLIEKDNLIKRNPIIITDENRDEYIKRDACFGKIVCRCEQISEGEIIEALNSPLKPKTLDAIKRRIRPGMGRCQGGFCANKVSQIISKVTGLSYDKILKENLNSNVYYNEIKQTDFFNEMLKKEKENERV